MNAEGDTMTPTLAVILAAGEGSRLFPKTNAPKALTRVFGLSLAERVMCTMALDVGVRRFIVVLGYEADTVRRHFTDVAGRRGLAVEFVEAPNWRLGNGASALSIKGHTSEAPFFLVMTDHMFDAVIAKALAADPLPDGSMRLAVDRDKDHVFDPENVIRVRSADGRIAEIGKDLDTWDAADTGVMLCSPGLFEGLERAASEGRHGLSDGLGELAREGRAEAVDVTGSPWLDVDTPGGLREAERRLLRQHGRKSHDGPVHRRLNRPLSGRISRVLVRTPLRPNTISLISCALCCVATALFAAGGYPALAAGGVMAQLAMIIDGCDGEVARLKMLQTDFGAWFDAVLDRYADAFLLFGLMWHEFAATGTHLSLLLGFAAIAGSFLNSYTADKYDGLMAREYPGATYLRLGRDVRIFIIFLGALLNQPLLILAVIAVVMNVEVLRRIVVCSRAGESR
jgi:CDP-L-myo-inositol myo-inositolphosphotransferase